MEIFPPLFKAIGIKTIHSLSFRTEAPVAQLDRVAGFEPVGWGFKSLQAYKLVWGEPEPQLSWRRNRGSYDFVSIALHPGADLLAIEPTIEIVRELIP